jgi:LacI family transcriptional regulator
MDRKTRSAAENGSRRTRRPTVFDVVQMTGFSRGTVSRAFSNSESISPATRSKILEAAERIGYRPHAGARLLKADRAGKWGMLVSSLADPATAKLFEALELEAFRMGTSVQVGCFRENPKYVDMLAGSWFAGEIDGLILAEGAWSPKLLSQIESRDLPIVFVGSRPDERHDVLIFDSSQAVRQVLRNLEMLGHERIAYVGDSAELSLSVGCQVWKDWLAARGKADQEGSLLIPSSGRDPGVNAWAALRDPRVRATAVLADSDLIACGIAHCARAEGLHIPRDLSLVGSGDIDEGRRLGLTTARPELATAASLVLRRLEERRAGGTPAASILKAESKLIVRDSVGRKP